MQLNPAWANFETVFNLKMIESEDEPGERFMVYHADEPDPVLMKELTFAGRFLHRQYLTEIPFVLVFSDIDCDCMHVGWNSWLPNIENWSEVLASADTRYALLNEQANELVLRHNNDRLVCDLDASKAQEYHEAFNLYCSLDNLFWLHASVSQVC